MSSVDWYDTPLYYDIVYSNDEEVECAFVLGILSLYLPSLPSRPRVLEAACGTGRLVVGLARRGVDIAGFDLGPRMIEFARERAAAAKVQCGELWVAGLEDFDCPEGSYDCVLNIVSSLKYLLTDELVQANLARTHRALARGGIYVVQLHIADYSEKEAEVEEWEGERDGINVKCVFSTGPPDRQRRIEPAHIHMTVTQGGQQQQQQQQVTDTRWDWRTYDRDQVATLIEMARGAGFSLEAMHDAIQGVGSAEKTRDLQDPSRHIILILRKT
jgi:SAM-dependent methyltransferase